MPTYRQQLFSLLTEGFQNAQELSSSIHLPIKDVLHHLEHIRKSVRPPNRFIMLPAVCINCGFVFKERRKLHTPSKCPKCRDTHISEIEYRIDRVKKP